MRSDRHYCGACGKSCSMIVVADLVDWADGSLRRETSTVSDCCEAGCWTPPKLDMVPCPRCRPVTSARRPSPGGYTAGDGSIEATAGATA
jgi:hypothetical protein